MAEGMSQTLADAALGVADDYTWVKLHTGAPGAAGTANAATNTTRQQATWEAVSSGSGTRRIRNSADMTWSSVPAAEDYTHFSVWSASTAGTFGWSGTITANPVSIGDDAVFAAQALVASYPVAS